MHKGSWKRSWKHRLRKLCKNFKLSYIKINESFNSIFYEFFEVSFHNLPKLNQQYAKTETKQKNWQNEVNNKIVITVQFHQRISKDKNSNDTTRHPFHSHTHLVFYVNCHISEKIWHLSLKLAYFTKRDGFQLYPLYCKEPIHSMSE